MSEQCETCGADVYSGPPDCPMCGAPNCCQQCCKIDHQQTRITGLEAENTRLQTELDDFQLTFQLRWDSDMAAIKCWRKDDPEKELIWPDHTDLSVWLINHITELENRIDIEQKIVATNLKQSIRITELESQIKALRDIKYTTHSSWNCSKEFSDGWKACREQMDDLLK